MTSRKEPKVIPPQEWKVNGVFGFQRAKDHAGQAVDLVRLADVVRWIESSKRVPRSDTFQLLIDAMPSDVMLWLYQLKPNAWAEFVAADATFGFHTVASLTTARAEALQDAMQRSHIAKQSGTRFGSALTVNAGKITALLGVEAVEPGRPALLAYLERMRHVKATYKSKNGEALDHPRELFSSLAIPHTKANALWGWGSVSEVVPLHSVSKVDESSAAQHLESAQPKKPKRKELSPDWDGTRLKARQTELKKAHTNFTALLANESGLPPREITERIKAAGGAVGSMAQQLGQAGGKR